MLYFEMGCPAATVSGALPSRGYRAMWFDPRSGRWEQAGVLKADRDGDIQLPAFPDGSETSKVDWALKLILSTRH